MSNGFVFGKFLPFHKGHEALMNFALTKCDSLTVVVCASDMERIPCEVRKNWIEETFAWEKRLKVVCYNFKEFHLPNSSVASEHASKLWAAEFKKMFPEDILLFTSEEYGDLVGNFMGIQHILFDIDRKLYPISSTLIRHDLFKFWKYLPDSVKNYFSIKVAIVGTESTGKTTLTNQLKDHFKCNCVLEAGRDLIPTSESFDYNDLLLVAKEHANRIKNAVTKDSPLVILDTDIHITKSYSLFSLGKELMVSDDILKINKSDLYLFLNKDVKFVQDNTRLSEKRRNQLDYFHRTVFTDHEIKVVEIKGLDWSARYDRAVKKIDELIRKKKLEYKNLRIS